MELASSNPPRPTDEAFHSVDENGLHALPWIDLPLDVNAILDWQIIVRDQALYCVIIKYLDKDSTIRREKWQIPDCYRSGPHQAAASAIR